MKLYATTRWVGVYQELSSLIPYEKILNILEIEGKWGLKFPNGFWKVLRPAQPVRVERRKGREKVNRPAPPMAREYGDKMGGVDLSDQYRSSYTVHQKSKRWYMALFYWVVDCALSNAFLCYATANRTTTETGDSDPKKTSLAGSSPSYSCFLCVCVVLLCLIVLFFLLLLLSFFFFFFSLFSYFSIHWRFSPLPSCILQCFCVVSEVKSLQKKIKKN